MSLIVYPGSTKSLQENLIEALRQAIWSRRYGPGERLNERAISEEFGVSRPPLREALRRLEAEGLVINEPRRGSFVKTFSGQDVRELYAVRFSLELTAAEAIAQDASADKIALLEKYLTELDSKTAASLEEAVDADFEFHRELVKLSGNKRLEDTWERLVGELRLALTLVSPEYYAKSYVENTHWPLLSAISSGDRDGIRDFIDQLLSLGLALGDAWDQQRSE